MEAPIVVLGSVLVMFCAAKLAGELFERMHQPPVIGEILAGILVGPFALGLIGVPSSLMIEKYHGVEAATHLLDVVYDTLAELGVLILLFLVGLETRLSDILKVGTRALVVATLGVVVPFILGYAFVWSLGRPTIEATFIATAMVATSVGITARVLADLGHIKDDEARIILGAAVIDDVMGMVVLAVVSGMGSGEVPSLLSIGAIAGQAIAFVVFVTLVGRHVVQRWSVHIEALRVRQAPFAIAVIIMLALAMLSVMTGLAAIIGAFLAGMVFAELREQYELERQVLPLYELFVPIFFVLTGSRVDWRLFVDGSIIGIALTVTALAILGKLVGCGAAALGMSPRSVAIIGVGMAPRGEVGLIVANVGRSIGVIPSEMFSTVVIMSVLTTLFVPPVLTFLYRGRVGVAERIRPADFAVSDGRLPDL